jgi:hypothetical protein
MEYADFKRQIDRLEGQWRSTYGEERKALLWQAFRAVPAEDFKSAVDDCLLRSRGAPLLGELDKAVNEAKHRRVSDHAYSGLGGLGLGDIINEAERANTTVDPDFIRACRENFDRFISGRLTKAQFLEGCDALDAIANQLSPKTRRPTRAGGSASADRRFKE